MTFCLCGRKAQPHEIDDLNPPTPSPFTQAKSRAVRHSNVLTVSGRYHRGKSLTDDYKVFEKDILGEGYNGAVYKATSKATGTAFAVKDFHYRNFDRRKLQDLAAECEIFLIADHPHVARLIDVYQTPDKLSMVTELLEGGEVAERVLQSNKFSPSDASNSLYQMLLAIKYIHEKNIVHRDIKLENFLYEKLDTDHLKLIDFGFSKIFIPNVKMSLSCGTLSYVAPEVLKKSYDNKCDMWSLGVCAFVLLAGYLPFLGADAQHMMHNIQNGLLVYRSSWMKLKEQDPTAYGFVMSLLKTNPEERLSAHEALQHDFITMGERHQRTIVGTSNLGQTTTNLCAFAHASKFRRVMLSAMAWSLSQQDRRQLRDDFLALDASKSGTITLNEFKDVIDKRFTFTDAEIESIFKSLDTGGQDEIHYSEFLAAMMSTKVNIHDDLLHSTFRRFDKSGNGYIEVEDMQKIFGSIYTVQEIKSLMKEADLKGNGRISYEDFIEFARSGEGQVAEATGKLIDKFVASRKDRSMMKLKGLAQSTCCFGWLCC